jgi:hypothetical protein
MDNTPFQQPHDPIRQKLIPEGAIPQVTKRAKVALASVEEAGVSEDAEFKIKLAKLKSQLQTALELEHSTIPIYLCALYSIKPGTNLTASEIIRSVVLEEMLHMIMVANLLNSIGAQPRIGDKETGAGNKFIPSYPTKLPGNVDPSLDVNLTYFSKESIRTFWRIEHPDPDYGLPAQFGEEAKSYNSIGAFYKDLTANLVELEGIAKSKGKTIFTGGLKNQVPAEHYYGAGGRIITVSNLEDAENVIEEIVGQGEGTLGSIFSEPYKPGDNRYLLFGSTVEEFAHYFRFKEIHYGRYYAPTDSAHRLSPNKGLPTGQPFEVDWEAVCKMRPNPKMADYKKGTPLYEKTYDFNKTYSALLDNIDEACNGNPAALQKGIPLMYELRYKAIELMNIPLEDGFMAGPSFEYVKA